jgi:hypothetical protein
MDFNREVLKCYACAFLEDGNRFSCRNIVCVCVRACVRVRMCARARVCVRACVCVCVWKTRVIKILQYTDHRIKNSFRTSERTKTVCIVDTSQLILRGVTAACCKQWTEPVTMEVLHIVWLWFVCCLLTISGKILSRRHFQQTSTNSIKLTPVLRNPAAS